MPKQPNKTEYATKSDLKELRGGINKDIKTHMGALYEKFSDDVKVLAESHLDTNKRVRNLEIKMDMLVDTVGEIKVDVVEVKEGLKNKADLKDQKLLEKRVATLETTI